MRQLGRVAIVFVLSLLAAPAISAERYALVIGNKGYNEKVGPLRNPHNDIALVGKALTEANFELLAPLKDATRDEMLFAVHQLAAEVRTAGPGAVSFLYYAGHGESVGSENVLIPTNVEDASDAMLSVRGVRLGEVLDILTREAPEAVHFAVLDACRNLRGRRGGTRGFRPVNEVHTGVVIAFSTAQGKAATDEGAKSTAYAAALAEEIVRPGRNDQQVFNAVRTRVVQATRGQTPWTHDGLIGDRVVFKPEARPPQPAKATPAQPKWSEAAEAVRICREVEGMSSFSLLGVLANRHKGTAAGDCIAARVTELKQTEAATKKKADEFAKAKAERQQLAMIKAEQDRKRAEDEKKRLEAAEPLRPGREFRDCADVCPVMVVLPKGRFTMGSPPGDAGRSDDEGPQREVTIGRPFAVGKYEVTFAEWEVCVAGGGCTSNRTPSDQGWGKGRRPVISVSWHDAKEYVGWLSRKTGKSYRLLSEAEWEYAARAGTMTRYAFGDTITTSHARYGADRTAEVGSFPANRFGLHDMHGNVWEWVEDAWHPTYQGAPLDGSVWQGSDVSLRVLRGGSWYSGPVNLRSANRNGLQPSNRSNFIGFRVSRTL